MDLEPEASTSSKSYLVSDDKVYLTRARIQRIRDSFRWAINAASARGAKPGEHVLSQTFSRCNRTWQLRLESQGPNLPPQLIIELLSPIKWSVEATITCTVLQRFNAVGSLVKLWRLVYIPINESRTIQRLVLGSINNDFDSISCDIDVQYLHSVKNAGSITSRRLTRRASTPSTHPASPSSQARKGATATSGERSTSGPLAGQSGYSMMIANSATREALKKNCSTHSKNVVNSHSTITGTDVLDPCEQQFQVATVPVPKHFSMKSHPLNRESSLKVLTDLFNSGKFSDVIITSFSGKKFKAHKAILSMGSSKFYKMLRENQDLSQNEIQLPNVSDDSLEKILEYIYTGQVANVGNNIFELYKASETFKLRGLKNVCLKSFKEKLDAENASEVLIFSDKANLIDLKKHVIKFMNQNIPRVLSSDSFQKMTRSNPTLVVELYRSLGERV